MEALSQYKEVLETYLKTAVVVKEPLHLYEPITYILSLGGKRLRPLLTLMACDYFGGDYKEAVQASLAVELFHNFSLIHDDIMDAAPLRRGKATVHEKWDVNTGILSGDAMLILAYQFFEQYEPKRFQELAKLFSKTAIEVCEGQQYDVDFESRNDVSVPEYLKMIDYKTAVLIGAALQMGAIVANASESCKTGVYEFGRKLGIAFQLQDDYLDAFGNPETFGKQVGGDILANKKTYLYLQAKQHGAPSEVAELESWFQSKEAESPEKILRVKALFEATGAAHATQEAIERYTQEAFEVLQTLKMDEDKKHRLRQFGLWLMKRSI